ncbi:MAG: CinA family nicotinamide mononucleotide deamidase-related protein [Anaerolinea sp.]
MSDNVTAEIIAIGTEILLGEITDTNSVYLAQTLRDYGINLYFMTSVGDNVHRIANAIAIAMGRADVIITCGGLGPTVDDMTRQGIAEATGRPLVFDERLLEQIRQRFNSFRMTMPDNNRRQAYLPEGAVVIENPVGTAPAFAVESDDKLIIALPGVPRELKFLVEHKVMPMLRERYSLGLIRARVLRAGGIGESALDERLGADLLENANPTVGLAAHHGIIDIRITAKGDSPEIVEQMLDEYEALVRQRVGDFIFGTGKDTIEQAVARQLAQASHRLAIVEAGLVGTSQRLLREPNSEHVVALVHSYPAPEEGYAAFNLDSSLSFREAVESLAAELSREHGASVVVFSKPDLIESADSEQATVVGVAVGEKIAVRGYGFGAGSEVAQTWVMRWGLANVWRMLKEQAG